MNAKTQIVRVTGMYSDEIKLWLSRREQKDQKLYETYGSRLEADHTGEFVAIDPAGQVIIDADPDEVLRKAVRRFGSGKFALKRIGKKAYGEWLSSRQS